MFHLHFSNFESLSKLGFILNQIIKYQTNNHYPMKRKLTFLLTALLLLTGMNVWAQSRTSITDVLNRELTGVTGSTYTSWEGKTSNSDAVYAGQSAGGNNAIQLRSNGNSSGIITTASGGTLTNVTVVWNSSTNNGRTLNV